MAIPILILIVTCGTTGYLPKLLMKEHTIA